MSVSCDGDVEKSLVEQIPSLIHDLRNPLQQLSASMELYRSQVSVLLFGMLSGCIEEMNQLISQAMERFERISRRKGSSEQKQQPPLDDRGKERELMNKSIRTNAEKSTSPEESFKYEMIDIRCYLEEFWQRNLAVVELKQNVDYEILLQGSSMPVYFKLPKLEVTRVLQNLFSNASKFTHNGYIKLLISFVQTANSSQQQLTQLLTQQHINSKQAHNPQETPPQPMQVKTNMNMSCKTENNRISKNSCKNEQQERVLNWNARDNTNISKSERINLRSLSSSSNSSSSSEEHNLSAMMEESSNSSKISGSFHNSTPPAFQVRTFSQLTQASNKKNVSPAKDLQLKNKLLKPANENSSQDNQLEQIPFIRQATSQLDESSPSHQVKKIDPKAVLSSPIQEIKPKLIEEDYEKHNESPRKFQQIFSKRKSMIHPSIRDLVNNANSNSCNASNHGNATAAISAFNINQGSNHINSEIQGYLKFEVADTGRGMTDEEMSKIFESFQQANPSIKHIYGGSGIGLFSAKTIAKKIGGDVVCHSQVNAGSSFIFYMPCVGSSYNEKTNGGKNKEESGNLEESQIKINEISRAQSSTIKSVKNGLMKADVDAAIQREITAENLDEKEKLDLSKAVIELGRRRRVVKLLYVDDSEFLLETMKNRLQRIGCVDVTTECSANRVISNYFSLASKKTFDVVLIDFSMNEMNGNQLAQAITANQQKYQAQQDKSVLVCFTGYSVNDIGFKNEGLKSGFSEFLQKPASLLQILQKLLQVLKIQTIN